MSAVAIDYVYHKMVTITIANTRSLPSSNNSQTTKLN